MWRGEVLKCVAAWLVVIAPSVTARTMARFLEYEAYWVLFRFLYGGQLTDPVLIIACDNLLWGSVA